MQKHISRFAQVALLFVAISLVATETATFAQTKAVKIDELMKLYHGHDQFNGVVLVSERGQVIYERAFGQANLEWAIPNTLDRKSVV